MDNLSFAPTDFPSLQDQTDALKKGLGRAFMWAITRKLTRESLLDACLHDYRYDRQCEDRRSDWLWKLIEASNLTNALRDPILDGLKDPDHDASYQLLGLAQCYALAGDNAFLQRLRQIVENEQKSSDDFAGEDELIAVDGEAGFLLVAKCRGLRLATEPWEWQHESILSNAIERWGRQRVIELLTTSSEAGCREFLRSLPTETPAKTPDQIKNDRQRKLNAITVEEILQASKTQDNSIIGFYRGWGKKASESDLKEVLDAILIESDPKTLKCLLVIFATRPMPYFDSRILGLCGHEDETVRGRAIRAIEQNRHPEIRKYAYKCISEGTYADNTIALLIRNYEHGDEETVCKVISTIDDSDILHWALMNTREMLEANETADSSHLGMLAYYRTPCALCRCSAAKLMQKRGTLPAWAAEEMHFDSDNNKCLEAENDSP